jgi:hypothetical protein
MGRSRGGRTIRIHACVDNHGSAVWIELTVGKAHARVAEMSYSTARNTQLQRLTDPMVWRYGQMQPTSWDVQSPNGGASVLAARKYRVSGVSPILKAQMKLDPAENDAAHNPDAANPNYVVPHGRLCGLIPTELLTLRRSGFTIDEIF